MNRKTFLKTAIGSAAALAAPNIFGANNSTKTIDFNQILEIVNSEQVSERILIISSNFQNGDKLISDLIYKATKPKYCYWEFDPQDGYRRKASATFGNDTVVFCDFKIGEIQEYQPSMIITIGEFNKKDYKKFNNIPFMKLV
jgi:hypothetical protein